MRDDPTNQKQIKSSRKLSATDFDIQNQGNQFKVQAVLASFDDYVAGRLFGYVLVKDGIFWSSAKPPLSGFARIIRR